MGRTPAPVLKVPREKNPVTLSLSLLSPPASQSFAATSKAGGGGRERTSAKSQPALQAARLLLCTFLGLAGHWLLSPPGTGASSQPLA